MLDAGIFVGKQLSLIQLLYVNRFITARWKGRELTQKNNEPLNNLNIT